MKKLCAVILVIVMLCSFVACGSSGKGSGSAPATDGGKTETPTDSGKAETTPDNSASESSEAELSEPELVWWHVKTETGIPTLVAELKNNNSVAIDCDFNVDYYKGSEKLYTSQDLYANAFPAGESFMVWDTWEIPAEADKIEITYTSLGESIYTVVPSSVSAESSQGEYLSYDWQVSGDYDEFMVNVAFFAGDHHCVSIDSWCFYEGDDPHYSCEPLEHFDSYTVYSRAYIYR